MSIRNKLIVAGLVALLLCGATVMVFSLWQVYHTVQAIATGFNAATNTPIPEINRTPVATAISVAAPVIISDDVSPPVTAELSTEEKLLQAILPERDQRLLAIRLKNNGVEIPAVVRDEPYNNQVGDIETFWVSDNASQPPRQFEASATLRYVTEHAYWWVENGFTVDPDDLARSAERFEAETYPQNRAFFGSEWTPGVDNDQRLNIFMGGVPGVAGYFAASNSYAQEAEPYSNEREMFFINLNAIRPGNTTFDSVLAHEFQHMIHWYQDRNEDTWVNEGMSELSPFINGMGQSNFVNPYLARPDTQLNSWADTPSGALPNYGGSFLFMAYFIDRYGPELTQDVVSHAENGTVGFDVTLEENGYPERFDDIFADFLVANYLRDPTLGEGHWGYNDLSIGSVAVASQYSRYPAAEQTTVYQYGTDYIEINGTGDVNLEFIGSTQVNVLDNQAHSGAYQWYSHRGDDTNTRLTHAFDLSEVDTATLNYWTWYDIEPDWDYAYVEVSTNGGDTWTILQAPNSVTTNPSGNAYGPGYTGRSNGWIEQSLDLSDYTGQEILVRFEYVTDDAVNRSGFAVDDISIPEIGFSDDVESGPNAWVAEGFVRIDNILAQKFLVQLIEIGPDETRVVPIELDETNYGTYTIAGLGDSIDRAVLIISGLTPVTTQPASYEYRLTQ